MPHEPLEAGDPLERTAMSGGSLRGQHIHDLTVTGGQAAVGSFRDVHFQDPRGEDKPICLFLIYIILTPKPC